MYKENGIKILETRVDLLESKLRRLSQYAGGLVMILIKSGVIDKKNIERLNDFIDEHNNGC